MKRGLVKFSEHPYAVNWSDKNIKKPSEVALHSKSKYWFNCPNCNHQFDSNLDNITKGKKCPYCAVPSRILCSEETCSSCFNKSFASSDKIQFWSKNNIHNPRDVFKKTDKKYLFNCEKCNHEFKIALDKLSGGGWCSYCYGKKICESDCEICFNRSFASHIYSKCWSNENTLSPKKVALHSNTKFKFKCDKCDSEFMKDPNSIMRGEWCRFCKNKTEKRLFEYLKNLYPNVISEFNEKWLGNMRFDFMIPELKLIIELDGEQHFEQIMNWANPNVQLGNDVHKTKLANERGYKVIRILQKEVFNNKTEWLDSYLKPHLSGTTNNLFIAIGDKYHNIYDNHKKLLSN
jgi:very-short-patch-repair endonuclease